MIFPPSSSFTVLFLSYSYRFRHFHSIYLSLPTYLSNYHMQELVSRSMYAIAVCSYKSPSATSAFLRFKMLFFLIHLSLLCSSLSSSFYHWIFLHYIYISLFSVNQGDVVVLEKPWRESDNEGWCMASCPRSGCSV